jgi:2-polyprenyl-3-methyl-5-hydroxy-6-metoxy-1,4-benzoquinol methylase
VKVDKSDSKWRLYTPMTIVIPAAPRDIAAEYRGFAEPANDLHFLTGRGDLQERTRAMIGAIVDRLGFLPGQKVLDVGCGDGSLLLAFPAASTRLGTVLTEEELARLRTAPHLAGIEFAAAAFDDLASLPRGFDCIVVNGALPFARTQERAKGAVRNMVALLAPNGKMWLGELLARAVPGRRFSSRSSAIRHTYSQHGALSALVLMLRIAARPRDQVIQPPAPLWVMEPSEMAAFAARFGLSVKGLWDCEAMTGDAFYSMQGRYSVLLSRSTVSV